MFQLRFLYGIEIEGNNVDSDVVNMVNAVLA